MKRVQVRMGFIKDRWGFIKIVFFCMTIGFLPSCATTKMIDSGTVISVFKLKDKTYVPGAETDKGLVIGAGTGAVAGAAVGTAMGLLVSSLTLGLTAPAIPAYTMAGAIIGGVSVGSVGASTGYVYGLRKQGKGLFDYVVKLDNLEEKMIIRQYSKKPFNINDRVRIVKKSNVLYIEQQRIIKDH